MHRDTLLTLYRFHVQANTMVLDVAAQLTEEEFTREFSPSHGSIRMLLLHILGGDYYFPLVCRGETPDLDTFKTATDAVRTAADLRPRFADMGAQALAYIEGLSDDDLHAEVSVTFGEHTFTLPRWQMLTQLLFHAHMHRGELSILMSELGHPLPTIDIMVHFIKSSEQAWPF